MSDFFKKIMYGDGGKKDFTVSDLPYTRKDVYKRLLRTQLNKLFLLNLWTLLFCLPFLCWSVLCLTYQSKFGETAEAKKQLVGFLVTVKYPLSIVFGAVSFIGFAGTAYVSRNLCWGMPTSVNRAFFRGVKLSVGQFIVLGIITSVAWCLFDFAFTALKFTDFDTWQLVFLYALLTFAIVLLCAGLMFAINLCSTYRISTLSAIKNSFLLAVKYFWKSIGALCVTVFPFIVLCGFNYLPLNLVAVFLLSIFGFVHVAVIWHLFTSFVFDYHINRENYPDFYRKGLAPISEETPSIIKTEIKKTNSDTPEKGEE